MSFRIQGLIHRLPSIRPILRTLQRRSASISQAPTSQGIGERWKTDPTYRRVFPPTSIRWTMPKIPDHIQPPAYALAGDRPTWKDMIACAYPVGPTEWYDEHLAGGMRNAGQRTAECLSFAKSLVKPGITTRAIEKQVLDWAFSRGIYPSSLNYGRFPGSLCTSVNNVIAHGVPNDDPLLEGDIVNLDIALYVPYEPAGTCYHGDTSTTVPVGGFDKISQVSATLIKATREALEAGIAACGPDRPYNGIGNAIAKVAEKYQFQIVPDLSGHGIGEEYHGYPLILQFANDDPGEMSPGTIFTIEPCLSEGSGAYIVDEKDNWSLYALDGARATQEEHTVMITETGVEVLTRLDN